MIELPDFSPLRATATSLAPTRTTLDRLDHLLVVTARGANSALGRLPYGKHLAALLATIAPRNGDGARELACRERTRHGPDGRRLRRRARLRRADLGGESRARVLARQAADARHRTRGSRRTGRTCRRRKPRRGGQRRGLCAAIVQIAEQATATRASRAYASSAPAAAIDLEAVARTSTGQQRRPLVHRSAAQRVDDRRRTARRSKRSRNRAASTCRFLGERELAKLGAGAFLAVARGNATRDAGILQGAAIARRRGGAARASRSSAKASCSTPAAPISSRSPACSTCTPTCKAAPSRSARCSRSRSCACPFGIDAWLAITENRLAADAYKSQDLVTAVDGTTHPGDSYGRRGTHGARRYARAGGAREAGADHRLRDLDRLLRGRPHGTLLGRVLESHGRQRAAAASGRGERRARLAVPDGRRLTTSC